MGDLILYVCRQVAHTDALVTDAAATCVARFEEVAHHSTPLVLHDAARGAGRRGSQAGGLLTVGMQEALTGKMVWWGVVVVA